MNKKSDRASNFELLRIIAMLCIIAGHFIGQGGGTEIPGFQASAIVLGSASRIAVNLFLMIGAWFLVDAKFRAMPVIKLYSETWFYAVLLTTIMFAIGQPVGIKDWINAFFPFVRRTLWFPALYICLLLLSPFLHKVFYWRKEKVRGLVVILFVLTSGVCTLSAYMDTYLDNVLWFCFVYIAIGYYKKYCQNQWKGKWIYLAIGVATYALMTVIEYLFARSGSCLLNEGSQLIAQYLRDFKSLPNVLISVAIFIFFTNLDIGSSRGINWLATNAFGVYVIHQVPVFHDYLWKVILQCEKGWNSKFPILYTIGMILLVYIVASLIDKIRVKFVEPIWMNSRCVKEASEKFDNYMKMETP